MCVDQHIGVEELTTWPEGYDIDDAAEFVITDVLALIEQANTRFF